MNILISNILCVVCMCEWERCNMAECKNVSLCSIQVFLFHQPCNNLTIPSIPNPFSLFNSESAKVRKDQKPQLVHMCGHYAMIDTGLLQSHIKADANETMKRGSQKDSNMQFGRWGWGWGTGGEEVARVFPHKLRQSPGSCSRLL